MIRRMEKQKGIQASLFDYFKDTEWNMYIKSIRRKQIEALEANSRFSMT